MIFRNNHVYACVNCKVKNTSDSDVNLYKMIELAHVGGLYCAHKDTINQICTICDYFPTSIPFECLENFFTFKDLGLYKTLMSKANSMRKKINCDIITLDLCNYDINSKQVMYTVHVVKYPYEYKIQCGINELPFHLTTICRTIKRHELVKNFWKA